MDRNAAASPSESFAMRVLRVIVGLPFSLFGCVGTLASALMWIDWVRSRSELHMPFRGMFLYCVSALLVFSVGVDQLTTAWVPSRNDPIRRTLRRLPVRILTVIALMVLLGAGAGSPM